MPRRPRTQIPSGLTPRASGLPELDFPGGVAIGPDGDAYVTNHGISPTAGEVLRVDVEPCD